MNSLGRILSNSPTSREAFRCQKGFEVLICFLQKLKGSLSPDASYGRTGLPKVELAHKIDAVFNLLSGKSQILYLYFLKMWLFSFFFDFFKLQRGAVLYHLSNFPKSYRLPLYSLLFVHLAAFTNMEKWIVWQTQRWMLNFRWNSLIQMKRFFKWMSCQFQSEEFYLQYPHYGVLLGVKSSFFSETSNSVV